MIGRGALLSLLLCGAAVAAPRKEPPTVKDLTRAADTVVHPDQLVWVVVGDRAKIEPGIRALMWGDIQLLDADGKPTQ